MYVHILSSCLGSTSASRALWVISKETGDEPLFRVTDGTTMEEILGAFVTFYAVEDVEALNTLTEFAVSKLLQSSEFCSSSNSSPHDFSESFYLLYNHFLHNFERNDAHERVSECMKRSSRKVWDESFKDSSFNNRQSSDNFTRGIVVARGRNEDLSWVHGIQTHHSKQCSSKMTCGPDDREVYELPVKLQKLKELEKVSEVKVYDKSFTSTSESTSLPFNLGGEAVIYLYHIINNYESLPDVTVFLQGEPVPSSGGGTLHFNSLEELHEAILKTTPEKRFFPISNLLLQNDWDTGFPYTEVNLRSGQREIYEMAGFPFNEPNAYPESNQLWWHACGMFAASREAIRSRPLHFYKALYVMLTDAYPVNREYPWDSGATSEGGVTDGLCEKGVKAEYGLYCTEFNTHTLFYVIERMWQYFFDIKNEVWHVDICGDEDLKAFLFDKNRGEWWTMFCKTDGGVREGGWLVDELETFVKGGEDATKNKPLHLSLLQPRPSSLVMTSTLDVVPILSVPRVSDVDGGFDGMAKALMCIEMGGEGKSYSPWLGGSQVMTNRLSAGDDPVRYELSVWIEDGESGAVLSNKISTDFTMSHPLSSQVPKVSTVLSFFPGHDSSIAAVRDGEVVCVLELERLFDIRYMAGWGTGSTGSPLSTPPLEIWRRAVEKVVEYSGIAAFDYGVYVPLPVGEVHNAATMAMFEVADELVGKWAVIDHHASHLNLAFLDSQMKGKVAVVSVDGGGNDGNSRGFWGEGGVGGSLVEVELGLSGETNLGVGYMRASGVISEVVGGRKCSSLVPCALGFPGKVMGYVALGEVRAEWVGVMERYLMEGEAGEYWGEGLYFDPSVLEGWGEGGVEKERDLSATLQNAFENIVLEVLEDLKRRMGGVFDGIVLSGGCALNVLSNTRIQSAFGVPVHIPAAPGDNGLSVGAAWFLSRPKEGKWQPLEFAGFPVWDEKELEDIVRREKGRLVDVEEVARMLVAGKIIGVVRGRQEFGPRALGNRSLISLPGSDAKDRMNRLKKREFFRPVAPIVLEEVCDDVFIEKGVNSPYMSFAPRFDREKVGIEIPAAIHYDGSARPQTVKEGWIAELLEVLMKDHKKLPVIINTSFNVHGKPIINSYEESVGLLRSEEELDCVLLENSLIGC
ncbi:hypothetical protein TL16_g00183 [Triparma laevis f. inornata]|uniref:Carbamoyltransferase n=1 Tax=Triparma laevis f. inornata TaxID=1714386 RepID=A0A9W6Z944_9STRA|nr:hypothetical protein TL16_g00183 [Triparma laevis f. inornata]